MCSAPAPMTDPAKGPADAPVRGRRGASGWLGVAYALAAAVTGLTIYLASTAPGAGALGPATRMLGWVVGLNLVLIGGISAAIGHRVIKLIVARARDASAQLHLRFALLFAAAAVIPAVVVALFFGVLVTRGVDSWFSQRVSSVVKNSASVARSYVNEQRLTIGGDVLAMAVDMNRAAPLMRDSPITYGRILEGQAANRFFPAAYVIDKDGRVLARAEASNAPPFVAPPVASLAAADNDVIIRAFNDADLMRALYKLDSYEDAYLYVVRRIAPGILRDLDAASGSLAAYQDAEANRSRVQAAFVLAYVETVLLVLVGAIWLGLAAANSISAPVGRLVQAAGRVAGGDLDARVDSRNDPEEIAVLSRAFNRMTSDLQTQQRALRAANTDAESRREFIETVLAGVSAGVIGLDSQDRISALNSQAAVLLDLSVAPVGQELDHAAGELAAIAAAARAKGEAEAEVDVVRRGESRRLRVRATCTAEGGLVLTFDDITRLVAAQRNAAWKDVARRIAHEIKNPLTPIQLSAERIRRKYRREITTDLETFDRCTDTIIRQVGDIGRMVDEFSAFARMPAPQFGEYDAAELLRQAVFAQRVASPSLTVEMLEPAPEVRMICDSRMIGQALTNVLKNAAEAIHGRQNIEPGVQGRILARLTTDAAHLIFEVEDNGVGLPAKDRDRLTEPYVTTREKGTGLGLAIVKRIVEDHEGELLLLDAAHAPGARAVLRFPLARSVEDAARLTTPSGLAALG